MPRPLPIAVVAYLAVAGLATLAGVDQELSLWGDSVRRTGLLTLVVAGGALLLGVGLGEVGIRALQRAAIVATAGLAGWVLARIVAGDDELGSVVGPVGNAGNLAGVSLLLGGAALSMAWSDAGPRWRQAGWVAAAATGGLILATGSQAGGAGLVVVVGLALWRSRATIRGRSRAVVAGLAAASLLGVVLLVVGGWFDGTSRTVRGRLDGWEVAAGAIAERPVLGWGPDGLRVGLTEHLTEDFAGRYGLVLTQDRAHNGLLDEAGATGILGVAALASVLVVAWRAARPGIGRPDRAALAIVLGGFAAFLLAWFATFEQVVLAAFVVGVLAAPERAGGPRAPRARRTAWGIAGGLVAVVTVLAASTVVDDRAVEARLSDLDALDLATFDRAVDAIDAQPGALVEVYTVAAAAKESLDADAIDAVRRLTSEADDPLLAFTDGDLLLARAGIARDTRDAVAAEARFRGVLGRSPNHGDAWHLLGRSLLVQGRVADADAALMRAAELLPRQVGPAFDLAASALQREDAAALRQWLSTTCGLAPDDPQVRRLVAEAAPILGSLPEACMEA